MREMSEYILELKGITKIFPGVKALDNVHFQLKQGMGRKTQNLQYEQCKRLIIKKLFNMIYNIKRSQDINQ